MKKTNQVVEPCNDYCSRCTKRESLDFNENLSLSYSDQTIHINDLTIKLTNRAFRVLCALLQHQNNPVSFTFLQSYGWPDNKVVRNNLTVIISEIKITLRSTNIDIKNIRGFGYILNMPIDEATVYKNENVEVTQHA